MNKQLIQGIGIGAVAGLVASALVVNNVGDRGSSEADSVALEKEQIAKMVDQRVQDQLQGQIQKQKRDQREAGPAASGGEPSDSLQRLVESEGVPEALSAAGIEAQSIEARFDAGSGLAGFVIYDEQRHQTPFLVYLTGDGQYLLNGVMFDRTGKPISRSHLTEEAGFTREQLKQMAQKGGSDGGGSRQSANEPQGDEVLAALQEAETVSQGSGDAELYALMDTNCPYCKRMYQTLSSMRDEVTVHWVLVGYQGEGSRRDAAAIMAHDDPAGALDAVVNGQPSSEFDIDTPDREAVENNTQIAQGAGLRGTPQGAAVTPEGEAEYIRGAVPERQLREKLGL